MEIDEYLIIDNEIKDKFYECEYGYIFANPQYNLYLNCCKIKKDCYCIDCSDFKKKKDVIEKPHL